MLKRYFRDKVGPVEKLWFRSICTVQDSKKPERAKIIQQEYGNFKDNKNAYVLFEQKNDAIKAVETLNQ